MRYIGNIITTSPKYRFNRFINVSPEIDNMDLSLPTLVVGVANVKKFFPEKLDYIDRKLENGVHWTFATTEKRSENERDLEKFKKEIVSHLRKASKYTFFNVLTCSLHRFKNFITFLEKLSEKAFYFTDKMLYISYEGKVMGISLDDCEYIGVGKRKIYGKIKKKFGNVYAKGKFLTDEEREFFENDDVLISAMAYLANS